MDVVLTSKLLMPVSQGRLGAIVSKRGRLAFNRRLAACWV